MKKEPVREKDTHCFGARVRCTDKGHTCGYRLLEYDEVTMYVALSTWYTSFDPEETGILKER